MRTIATHSFAVAFGVLAVLLFRPASVDTKAPAGGTREPEQVKRVTPGAVTPPPLGISTRIDKRPLGVGRAEKIEAADLEQWLAGKRGDSRSLAEAQAIAGLLTNNPDLIRHAIKADPENPHLLYIGATHSSFTEDERLSLGERFIRHDPQNGLAAYIHAAQLFKAGDTKNGIEILRSSINRPRFDAFAPQTQLLMDEAYIAAGCSPLEAKALSVFSQGIPYIADLQSFAVSLNDLGNFLPPDKAADLRALGASMGMRLNGQMGSATFIDHLIGLKFEEQAFAGMASDSPSPYDGITVEQARQGIANERAEIRKLMQQSPMEDILAGPPELVESYIERFRLLGEPEATKWWFNVTRGQK